MLLNKTCPWCGQPLGNYWNREHIIPKSLGGRGSYNLMKAHPDCNRNRGTVFRIPSLYNNTLLYCHFDKEQTLYFIRDIWLHREMLRCTLSQGIKNCKCLLSNTKETDVWYRFYIRTLKENEEDLRNLNDIVNFIETKGINPNTWIFNED